METKIYNSKTNKSEAISQAVSYLQNKEAIVFPTETVYGLGADATKLVAVDEEERETRTNTITINTRTQLWQYRSHHNSIGTRSK